MRPAGDRAPPIGRTAAGGLTPGRHAVQLEPLSSYGVLPSPEGVVVPEGVAEWSRDVEVVRAGWLYVDLDRTGDASETVRVEVRREGERTIAFEWEGPRSRSTWQSFIREGAYRVTYLDRVSGAPRHRDVTVSANRAAVADFSRDE